MSKPEDERTKEESLRTLEDLKVENKRLSDVIHNLRVELTELTDQKSKSEIGAIKLLVAIRENLEISIKILESFSANKGSKKDADKSLLLYMINRSLKHLPTGI